MTCMQITLSVPGTGPAVLTLQQPLTSQALLDFEHDVAGTLGMLRRDLPSVGFGAAHEQGARRPEAAEIEYASWMPDPGAIEFASWAAHMRTSLR